MKQLFQEDCIIVCKNSNRFYKNNNYDINISNKKYAKHFIAPFILGKLAKNAKFFIYLWSDGFLHNREFDFKFLRRCGIPIICLFLGDDIRSRKIVLDYCNSINFNTYVEYDNPELFLSDIYDNRKKALAEQADKYASIVFSHKFDQYSYLKSDQHFFPPLIDEALFSFDVEKFSNRPLRIVHAPSNPVSKGTPIVRSVIKRLKHDEYDFQYVELMHMPNETVIWELKRSHVVLNQFYSLITGIFGLEAMATGNAVLMSAKAEYFPYQFNDAWLETEDWQLYSNLKYLLDNPGKMIEYAKNGYDYVTKNFSKDAILNTIKSVFLNNGIVFDDVDSNHNAS
jgi:glycosyltransferase involved in cell wall biosynthesis